MKKLFFIFMLLSGVLVSCKDEAPDPGLLAAVAAKGYYDQLKEGNYADFVAGFNRPNRLPKKFQDQLVLNAQMFMEQQQKERKGISAVHVLTAKADTTHHVADVFLQFVYGDSTREQIVVPMVKVGGVWKMK